MPSTGYSIGNRSYGKPNTYNRNRYKKTYWRRDALNFLKKKHSSLHYGSWAKNFMHNTYHAPAYKVGWTAKTAPVGRGRSAQNRWRRAYFKKHGSVV